MPTIKHVKFADDTMAAVPCYDFKDMLTSLLTDEDLNHDKNLIKSGIDKITWRPSVPMQDWKDDNIINDINTGTVCLPLYLPSETAIEYSLSHNSIPN